MNQFNPLLKFPKKCLIVIDTDTTGLIENGELVAIHAVEIENSKFTRIFFHVFINKRSYNQDYMYYFAEYNYCFDPKKELSLFLIFVIGATIVTHIIEFDIKFINKELQK